MELKVNVDGYVRVVCGVTEDTTCQDLVIALAHAMGRTGRFSLLEKWRVQERSLPPWERPLQVLQKWGEYAAEVQFTLQRTDRDEVRRATDAINKIGISGPEHCGRNFSPPPPAESTVKRSLTFSGAHSYSQPAKMGGATTFAQHRVPANMTEKSAPSHHHHQHQHSKYSLEKCPQRDSHHYDQPDTPHSQLPKPHSQKPHTFPQHHLGPKSRSAQSNYPQNINNPSNPSKPISSIKPQPKPRTLPLRTITEKLPSRTVGTVSPIQTKRQLTTIGHTTSSRVPLSQDEARPSLEQVTHDVPETTKVDGNKNRDNYYNNINHNNVYSNDDDEYNITTTNKNNDSNNSGLQILDNFNSEEHTIDSGPPDPRTTLNRNIEKPRTKYCFANDIMSMKASNLAQIEEYDLDKNFPLSLRSSPEANNLGENYAECYVIQGENEFEGQPPEDPDSQALLQLINIQHEKLELQKVRIKDIDLEIISAEELIEREKEIQELQSLSDEYEEELVELEPWPQILEEEQCIKQAFDLEMDSCKQKITDCEDRLQKAQSRVSELSRELEQEVFKIEQEISDIQEKIKRGLEANDDYEGAIDRIDKEISELDLELEKKQTKESNLCEEVKQLNLKELGQKPMLEATKLSETGEAAGILILKLLEKQQQFTRQGSGSKKGLGSKMEDETVSTTTTTTTTNCTEPKSVTTNDGVWV